VQTKILIAFGEYIEKKEFGQFYVYIHMQRQQGLVVVTCPENIMSKSLRREKSKQRICRKISSFILFSTKIGKHTGEMT